MAEVAFHRPDREYPERVPKSEVVILVPPAVEGPVPKLASLVQFILFAGALAAVGSLSVTQSQDHQVVEGTLAGAALAAVMAVAMRSVGTGKRKRLRAERRRYYAYLQQQEVALRKAAEAQHHVDERLYPTTTAIAALVTDRRFLWERRVNDPDFMSVCVGRGRLPLNSPAKLEADDRPAKAYDPLLLLGAHKLVEHFTTLSDGAVTIPLRDCATVVVTGQPDRMRSIARSIIVQAAVFHAPLDLTVMGFLSPDSQREWEWLKWLPHIRPHDQRGRLCAITDDVSDFTTMLAAHIAPRDEAVRKAEAARTIGIPTPAQPSEMPHLVVLIDGFALPSPLASVAPLVEAARRGRALGISVLMVVPDRANIPPAVDVVIDADRPMATVQFATGSARTIDVHPETVTLDGAETMARAMTPLRLDEENPREELAGTVRLLDLLGLADAAATNPAVGWRPRPRSSILQTPIGVGAADTTIVLDLKDALAGGSGPHGLIAGTAGSGKSELIRTIITGLASSHSPDVLSIACIDVEGAGNFEEFRTLPHLAGIIGGLLTDDDAVELMRASLINEGARRLRLLADAGTTGIREYQKRREQTPSMEPLPSLLVVVDDAGRLFSGRHGVVELFTDLAADAHNMGIHLLFSGRSFDGWSLRSFEGLLRYRICLHLDSVEASSAVLGSADAYHLPDVPGAACMKIEGGAVERFRVARISAPYGESTDGGSAAGEIRLFTAIPQRRVISTNGDGAAVIDPTYTEMDVVVERLGTSFTRRAGHEIFVPPDAPVITLGAVLSLAASSEGTTLADPQPFGHLRVPIGVVLSGDDSTPGRPLFLDLSDGANVGMVGGSGMGRSTFLRTVLGAFILTHSPRDLRIVCVDLGGGGLADFADAPHLLVSSAGQPSRAVLTAVARVRKLIDDRQAAMQRHGVTSLGDLEGKDDIDSAQIVLALDDVSAMGADALDGLSDIIRRGPAAGVTIIATAGSWLEVPADVRTALGNRLELRLRVPRHSVIDTEIAETVPIVPGQGLVAKVGRVQIAVPQMDRTGDGADLDQAVRELVIRAKAAWVTPRARRQKTDGAVVAGDGNPPPVTP